MSAASVLCRLNDGTDVIVDADDAILLERYAWHATERRPGYRYVERNVRVGKRSRKAVLHRLLAGAAPGEVVDHINGNTLDNRRSNLRVCSRKQNARNSRRPAHNRSGFKGVSWDKQTGRWRAT